LDTLIRDIAIAAGVSERRAIEQLRDAFPGQRPGVAATAEAPQTVLHRLLDGITVERPGSGGIACGPENGRRVSALSTMESPVGLNMQEDCQELLNELTYEPERQSWCRNVLYAAHVPALLVPSCIEDLTLTDKLRTNVVSAARHIKQHFDYTVSMLELENAIDAARPSPGLPGGDRPGLRIRAGLQDAQPAERKLRNIRMMRRGSDE